jgi:2-polyprenyl-3-methyl-5-hydroxy-6-metoxy-1,4-benzoquinol methylase
MKKLDTIDKMFTDSACMLCNSMGASFVNNLRDDTDKCVVRCNICEHVQVYPLPKKEENIKYYENDYVKNMSDLKESYKNKNNIQLMDKFKKIAENYVDSIKSIVSKEQKMMEIGSGYGWFIEKMRKEGYTIDGVEVGENRAQLAFQRSGITLTNHDFMFNHSPMRQDYDVIFMFHVLEHLNDPITFLNNVKSIMKPSSTLIIEVPNYYDNIKQLSSAYNNFSYFRAHLSYFTPNTLTSLLNKTGFSDINIKGVQRYSVENAIRWIRTGKPNIDYLELELPDGLEWVNQHYKDVMEKELKSYAILATAKLQ